MSDMGDLGNVFISHTSDMASYPAPRSFVQAASEAVLRAGGRPVEMANFAAREDSPAEYCIARVAECDVYIAIIGFTYGSVVPDHDGISYTELEFQAATTAGIPRLVFLLDPDAALPRRLIDVEGAPIEDFRQRLCNSGIIVQMFTDPGDLNGLALHALNDLRNRKGRNDHLVPQSARRPWVVPAPMGPVVDRAKLTTALLAALTGPGSEAVGLTTTLEGAGGFGKTTLAAYVCRSPEVVKRFPGGLLWATLGEHRKRAELADEICRLCEILSGERPGTADPWVAGSRLGELLDRREPTLMVVDDVWTKTQLEPFLIGGPACVRLITTRNVGVVPRDGVMVPVDEMSVDEAVATVTAGTAGMQSGVVDRLVRLAGRWPVLLGLINAAIVGHVQAGASLDDAAVWVADRLERDGPTAVDVDDPESRDQAVSSTMAASLRLLNTWERDRYLDLAIFPEDTVIDDQTLNLLWGATSQANIEACRQLRSKLTRLRLASARWHSSSPALSLHDVIRAYLLHEIGDDGLMATHSRFVEAARTALGPSSSSAWYSLPDEVLYLWQFIPYHLSEAGYLEELALLVCDLRWVEAKIQRLGSPAPIVTDLALMNTPRANLMQRALVEVAYLLAPAAPISVLSATLVTRLDGISGLQDVVARYRGGLARPRLDNGWELPDRDDSSANVHAGTVVDCAASPDGRLIASASDDATIRLWDRQTGMFIRAFRGHTDRVRSCSFSPDGVLISSASADTTIRLWETATGRMVRALRGHTARVT
ncbi:DUF4062 domain-containing protein, partial [Frankia sp. CiP3]|uniref:DUF4062 domain-containing protein n=1 Tax=Frankia sp. CiP3 TaxID=2880971 RepID=UPI0035AB7626